MKVKRESEIAQSCPTPSDPRVPLAGSKTRDITGGLKVTKTSLVKIVHVCLLIPGKSAEKETENCLRL